MTVATGLQRAAAAQGRPDEAWPARAQAHAAPGRWHVCFVAPYAWPAFSGERSIPVVGGAEVQQAVLARLFAAHGYRVSMICQDFGQPDGVRIDGVTVRKVFGRSEGLPVLRFVHPRLTKMWRVLTEVDADIYYYRSASMWVGILDAFCTHRRKRLVYAGASDRDFEPGVGGQIRYARDRWLYRRGVARAHALVAQNAAQVESARRHYRREAVQVPSCYHLPASARPAKRDRVLWAATLRPTKRPELFLELARRLPAWRFVMIGGPPSDDEKLFERIAAQGKALPNLELTGFLPLADVEGWFDHARVLVNTSLYEGMPNTFLQAWARGVPTLSTVDVAAPVNRVVTGIDAMTAELERLLTHPDAWHEASVRSREYFTRMHSSAEVMARYARLFDQVMAA